MSNSLYREFRQNLMGRDFVVGDIHGAFESVIKKMNDLKFDKKTDRLFCVGDIIDRGLNSVNALQFLKKPYIYSVLGNHDFDFMTNSLDTIRTLGMVNFNGLGWVTGVPDEKLLELQSQFRKLPIAIKIQTDRGTVGLVHGDVPKSMDWNTFAGKLKDGDESTMEVALTGRNRIQCQDTSGVHGIDRLFVGHSIQWDGPKRLGNVYAIDCGAVFRELNYDEGALTMANIVCKTEVLTPNALNNEFRVRTGEAKSRFGQYSQRGN